MSLPIGIHPTLHPIPILEQTEGQLLGFGQNRTSPRQSLDILNFLQLGQSYLDSIG